jgi:hypothetical protein
MDRSLTALALGAALLVAPVARAQEKQNPAIAAAERIRADVAKMRGLEYQAPVKVGVKTPAEIRAMIMESFEKEASAEDMAKEEKVYKAFGLIPRDYDLRARLIDFLSEQIGGYYDNEKKELFLVDMTKGDGMKLPQQAQGMMDEMVMAHELHHALQDQNFDLTRWFELLDGHDDRIQGYKSLVEGEAQLVGMSFFFKKMGMGNMGLKAFNRLQEQAMAMPSPESAKMRAIPPFLLENMMFPYTQGAEFVEEMQKVHGWARIGAAFADPPESTEQVLHPEKFFGAQRDVPTELRLPVGLKSVLGEQVKELYTNVLGEFNVTVLLRALGLTKAQAAKGGAGWDGDRYAGFETKDGRVVLVWLSTWDGEEEAKEFEGLYGQALAKAGKQVHLERRGADVLPKLVRRGFAALKVEEKYSPMAGVTARPPREDFTGEAPKAGSVAAPAGPAGLLRVEIAGATLAPPPGFTPKDEPIGSLQGMTALYLEGPDGAQARLMRMPVPVGPAAEQILGLVKGEVKDAKLEPVVDGLTLGRKSKAFGFEGTVPGGKEKGAARVVVLDLGADSLVVGVATPKGGAAAEESLVRLLQGLWLDGVAGAKAGLVTLGAAPAQVVLEELDGFTALPGKGPILGTFEHPQGGKIQVVVTDASNSLEEGARLLQAQLPVLLEDYAPRAAGVVTRAGGPVHELEFTAGGRRTRQLTFDRNGKRITVACSAPLGAFDALQPAFGRALASVRAEVQAKQPERKAY